MFLNRFLNEALIKEKLTPVKIYEVFDFDYDENKKTREQNENPLQEAFALYQQGEFLNAITIYKSCCKLSENLQLSESYSFEEREEIEIKCKGNDENEFLEKA